MDKKEEQKKVKRPTAKKRDIRNQKTSMVNRIFKSKARGAMRRFEEALKSNEKEAIQETLNGVYSVVDRGVKRNIYKQNKASRIKARATAKVARLAS